MLSLSRRSSIEQAVPGFDHKVEALRVVLLYQHSPVGTIRAERRRDLESAGELGVNPDRFVLLQLLGERALCVGLVDSLLVH